ncbi:MAG TPA: hypothetical protein VL101_17085 [Nordella sp.]|nr:hypothetical protein [Nordella sp.]
MARYQISPDDVVFAREFMADPFGYRSPGLQRVLNVMRGLGPAGKYVILCTEPYRRWQLGRLPAKRGEPIAEVDGIEYGDLATAERDVFLRRWRDLGGPDLPSDLPTEGR